MPSTLFLVFRAFFFPAFFSHCGLRDVRHVHDMASIQKLTLLGKAIEVPFIIVIASLHQSDAVLPRYIPVLQQSCVERDDLIERYFQLGLQHWEILAFLLLSDRIVLSLRQLKRILARKKSGEKKWRKTENKVELLDGTYRAPYGGEGWGNIPSPSNVRGLNTKLTHIKPKRAFSA